MFFREDWRVKHQSLQLSRKQLENTDKKIELGQLAPRDRHIDAADVATKEEQIIRAETAILDGEDALKRQILPFDETESWDLVIVPTLVLGEKDPEYEIPDWREAIRIARLQRPDLLGSRRQIEQANLVLLRAERDLLPNLDLSASYSADAQRDNFNKLQRDIFNRNFPDISVTLNLVIPLGNAASRSTYRKAKFERERAARSLRVLEIDVELALRQTIRALRTLQKTIASAQESVSLAENNHETELIKLRLGSSTQFDVQRTNTELADARSRLLRSRLDYRTSWTQLQAVQGLLVDADRTSIPGTGRSVPGKGKD